VIKVGKSNTLQSPFKFSLKYTSSSSGERKPQTTQILEQKKCWTNTCWSPFNYLLQ